jgi:hypothetical protein
MPTYARRRVGDVDTPLSRQCEHGGVVEEVLEGEGEADIRGKGRRETKDGRR